MKQKCISLADEDMIQLKKIREQYGLKSDSQVISFLLQKTKMENKEIAETVRSELEEHYLPKERIRWGVQTAEQNSIILLDAMNTLLWMLDGKDCIMADDLPHPVIKQSKEKLKEKIAYFKQKSDERKSKRS